jgi:hypothetical protein
MGGDRRGQGRSFGLYSSIQVNIIHATHARLFANNKQQSHVIWKQQQQQKLSSQLHLLQTDLVPLILLLLLLFLLCNLRILVK